MFYIYSLLLLWNKSLLNWVLKVSTCMCVIQNKVTHKYKAFKYRGMKLVWKKVNLTIQTVTVHCEGMFSLV